MYTLYYDKEKRELKIQKANKSMQNIPYYDDVFKFNDCYYTCLTRNPLKEKAKEMLAEWIYEAEENLKKFQNIKL